MSFVNTNTLTIDRGRAYCRRMATPEHDAEQHPDSATHEVGAGGAGALHDVTIAALRVLVVVLILGLVLTQTVILPLLAHESAQTFPEVAYLQVPFLVLAILGVACAQVVLWCIWKLLGMVRSDSIFTGRAFRYVDVIIWAAVAGGAILAGMQVVLGVVVGGGGPGVVLILVGGTLCCLALALLMLVMRGLLRKATTMHDFIELVA